MSKYNEQHATTMLNALIGTETLKRYEEKIRKDAIEEYRLALHKKFADTEQLSEAYMQGAREFAEWFANKMNFSKEWVNYQIEHWKQNGTVITFKRKEEK